MLIMHIIFTIYPHHTNIVDADTLFLAEDTMIVRMTWISEITYLIDYRQNKDACRLLQSAGIVNI